MRGQESVEDALIRWQMLEMVQEHYRDFIPFLEDVMTLLGFSTTDIQRDIAGFIAYGPQHLMVMAQRGQAKTTIVAAYAVWALIHNPHYRILVISAGGAQANDIAVLIIRIIMNMSQLECMRPDKLAGDRTSTENFDLHHSIKGVDKSASIACMGIGANLQGRRADILIPDDVESSKNSTTPTERAKLSHLVKDFPSIANAAWARILWMGTPQSMESIYNGLAAKGCTIRIWPGRYPTPAQREHYGDKLAPLLTQRLARDPSLGSGGGQLGDQGQATDPILRGEEALQHVELIQDTAYFQLQHMLNTAMSDAMRHPLKTERLVMAAYGAQMPLEFVRGPDSSYLTDKIVGDFSFRVSTALHWSKECAPMQSVWAYVDPAAGGANADETAYAVAGFLNGNIYLLEVGGLPGGYDEFKLTELANRLAKYKLTGICIEKNMGHGAFRAVFEPYARKVLPGVPLSDDLVTGQKEMRIINILAPIIGRGSLAVCDQVFEQDAADIAKYSPNVRLTYSFFYQLAHLSAARNALVHDDRLDAVAGVCNLFVEALAQDQSKKVALLKAKEWEESIKDPLGKNRYGSVKDARPQTLLQRRGQGLLQRRANSRSR
jgi:hypothetical protein